MKNTEGAPASIKPLTLNEIEEVDTRTSDELLDIIEAKRKEIQEELSMLRELYGQTNAFRSGISAMPPTMILQNCRSLLNE